ncbi:MAG: M15 family metallopeptidase [Defluviitaleaceae bacterium]|nr:M15 family metallopeptidase [Defluviitaleaceae bacterium]
MIRRFAVALFAFVLAACGGATYEPYEIHEEGYEEVHEIEEVEEVEEVEEIVEEVLTIVPEPIFTAEPLPDYVIALITGVSFRGDTPFGHEALTYLTMSHVDFEGESRVGHMIVAAELGDEVLDIFRELYEARFPIYQMRLIDHYGADDVASMEANNSHAFNFRFIAGTTVVSQHGFGRAIDINPIQNPYVRGDNVLPAAGMGYLDRDDVRPGMVVPGCPAYTAFVSRGWTWGGNWTSLRDYHHFERRN